MVARWQFWPVSKFCGYRSEKKHEHAIFTVGSQSTSTQLKKWGDYTKDETHQKIDGIYEETDRILETQLVQTSEWSWGKEIYS